MQAIRGCFFFVFLFFALFNCSFFFKIGEDFLNLEIVSAVVLQLRHLLWCNLEIITSVVVKVKVSLTTYRSLLTIFQRLNYSYNTKMTVGALTIIPYLFFNPGLSSLTSLLQLPSFGCQQNYTPSAAFRTKKSFPPLPPSPFAGCLHRVSIFNLEYFYGNCECGSHYE